MKTYNIVGYSLILLHLLGSAVAAPPDWGWVLAALFGFAYLVLIWLISGLYFSDVLHMGIAHKALDYKPWFIKTIVVVNGLVGLHVDPTSWVNRHRHHHAFSDQVGDPNKLDIDGFWRTLYLCFFPYPCRSNLARDPVLSTRILRASSTWYAFIISQVSSFALLWLVTLDVIFSAVLWISVRLLGLWINMLQNYWTHDRRFGTRRYQADEDNAMNLGDWLPVTASFSASLQNNHHHFPHFLRTSHANNEYDFGFLTVRAMHALGLVRPTRSGAQVPEGIPLKHHGLQPAKQVMKSIVTFFSVALVQLLACASLSAQAPSPTPTPAATPPPSHIYIADVSKKSGRLELGEPKKITTYAGYNNQPFFLPDGHSVLYTSIRNGQADIYRYDIRSGATSQVTNTPESEYSPTLMPDGKNISVVRVEADGTQRLWKFSLAGGSPSLILENIKPVGYHWWLDRNTLALFILGSGDKPATLQIADLPTGKAEVVSENPGRILRLIPHQPKLSFVHKISDQEWIVKSYDLKTKQISELARTLPAVEDYAWLPDGSLLMGKDAKLFKWSPDSKNWQEISDLSATGLKSMTRIAVSPKGDRIAIVSR
jgi:fatty-acid desaturase